MNIIPSLAKNLDEFREIRRDIHSHPELGYSETRTAGIVASKLSEYGIEVYRHIGRTGVVGVLRKGRAERGIGLRADMDALPLLELNTFPHVSRHPGVMHACGHDGHTAMLLAAARYLSAEGDFDGTVHFVFQPAEEAGAGARAMIDDGLFERFPMQAMYGMHNRAGLPVGSFGINHGPVMTGSATFRIRVHGRGGHGGRPHLCVDPVPVSCHIVLALQSIVARNVDPNEAAVVSVTMIHAGEASNVIPGQSEICGTVRAFSNAMLDVIEHRMKAMAHHTAKAHDCDCDVAFERGYPATVNEPRASQLCAEVIETIVGASNVQALQPSTGSEDFAFFLEKVPGAYVFIGNGKGTHREAGHGPGPCETHNPSYDFNDEIIPLGATYWARLAEAALKSQ